MNEDMIRECCIAYNQVLNNQPDDERDQTKAMQAAIAAHSAFIREAAARKDVVEVDRRELVHIMRRLRMRQSAVMLQDCMNYGMHITRNGQRVNPMDFYAGSEAPDGL